MEKIVVLGYGGHAKSVIDCIAASGRYEIVGYTDMQEKSMSDIPYLGTDEQLSRIFLSGVQNAAFGLGYMGNSHVRDRLYEKVKNIGFTLPCIVDPTAILARDVQIGEGTFVGKRAVVNAGSRIGSMCIINSGAIVEHENEIRDFTHISVGTVLCGNVTVGRHCFIGANATVLQGKTIEDGCVIGAGSVVLQDVRAKQTRYGVIR